MHMSRNMLHLISAWLELLHVFHQMLMDDVKMSSARTRSIEKQRKSEYKIE